MCRVYPSRGDFATAVGQVIRLCVSAIQCLAVMLCGPGKLPEELQTAEQEAYP